MDTIDMHVHSTASDGTFTPTEVANLALDAGLKAFALTDHDTTNGINEVMSLSLPIEIIPGIELSSKAYRKFVAEIKGNINGNDYVTSFKWIN